MNFRILSPALLLAVTLSAGASGNVFLDNFAGGGIFVVNTSVAAPNETMVQVFAGSTLLNVDGEDTFLTFQGSFGEPAPPVGGYFVSGGEASTGYANNGSGSFTINAWYGAATYELAQVTPGALYGTVTWTQSVGTDVTPAPPNPGLMNPQLFMVAAVPEPTTVVLGALGGLALLARRRKA